jgi:hypothetical protein
MLQACRVCPQTPYKPSSPSSSQFLPTLSQVPNIGTFLNNTTLLQGLAVLVRHWVVTSVLLGFVLREIQVGVIVIHLVVVKVYLVAAESQLGVNAI